MGWMHIKLHLLLELGVAQLEAQRPGVGLLRPPDLKLLSKLFLLLQLAQVFANFLNELSSSV